MHAYSGSTGTIFTSMTALLPGLDEIWPPVASGISNSISACPQERLRQTGVSSFQRNNITGASLEATLQVLIHEICGVLPARTPKLNTLRGFELAPAGYHSKPDLVLFSALDFRLLISTKWTLRKERIGTYLHEAYFYKQRRSDLQIAFVVSEFNLNIVEWLVNDPLVDRVYHVHRPMLLAVHQPFSRVAVGGTVLIADLVRPTQEAKEYGRWLALSDRLFDLSHLFADIEALKAPQTAVDPEISGDTDESEDDV